MTTRIQTLHLFGDMTEHWEGSCRLASMIISETVFHEDSVWKHVERGEPSLDRSSDRAVFSWGWERHVRSRKDPAVSFVTEVCSTVEVIVMPASIILRYSEAKLDPLHERSVGAERQVSRHILGSTISESLPMTILCGEWETLEQIVKEAMEKIVRDIRESA